MRLRLPAEYLPTAQATIRTGWTSRTTWPTRTLRTIRTLVALAAPFSAAPSLPSSTAPYLSPAPAYYFSSQGDDSFDCESPESACRTLERLNALSQAPGTRFLLRRGDRFPGSILIRASGREGAPLAVEAYGEGAAPVIDGGIPVDGWALIRKTDAAWIYAADLPPRAFARPFAVIAGDRILPLARHPDDRFAPIASGGSEFAILDPAAAAAIRDIPPGAQIRCRGARGVLAGRVVESYESQRRRLTWKGPLPGSLPAESGILLLGFPDALDRPWEWYCYPPESPPAEGRRLRLALPPGQAPGTAERPASARPSPVDSVPVPPPSGAIMLADAGFGIKGSGLSHVRIEGIAFENQVSAAVYCYGCDQVAILGCSIRNAVLKGIDYRGKALTAVGNSITGAAVAAISAGPGPDASPFGADGTGALIADNRISGIGLSASLGYAGSEGDEPMGTGILAKGNGDRILDNRIDSAAGSGIRFVGRGTRVAGNLVRAACLFLHGIGAIEAGPGEGGWIAESSTVRRNVIVDLPANADGAGAGATGTGSRAYGIRLDASSRAIAAEGNFIAAADFGIGLPPGLGHTVADNVLFGIRARALEEYGGRAGAEGVEGNRYRRNTAWLRRGRDSLDGERGPASASLSARLGPGTCPEDAAAGSTAPRCMGNVACMESDHGTRCADGFTEAYPDANPEELAERLRDLARRMSVPGWAWRSLWPNPRE